MKSEIYFIYFQWKAITVQVLGLSSIRDLVEFL